VKKGEIEEPSRRGRKFSSTPLLEKAFGLKKNRPSTRRALSSTGKMFNRICGKKRFYMTWLYV